MLMKTHLLWACAALAISLPICSNAHDGHSHHDQGPHGSNSLRLWRDVTGMPIHEGSFVAARENEVVVQDREGEFISIELDLLGESDRTLVADRIEQVRRINTQTIHLTATNEAVTGPVNSSPYLGLMQRAFGVFKSKVETRSDARYFYVESDSIPDHQMMVGITAWQQQVPIPQPYKGVNAWQIPLHPVKAAEPMSAKEHFFRGAIALAVNGVPIFNPIKNDGRTDTVVAGELDKWGGHCGRADDYHYHIAPTHLQDRVGAGNPVAFALDGYPVFGFTEPDGSPLRKLDWMGGHTDKNGNYHYHATKTYPYLVGGFRGEVHEVGGQVDPQPRAQGVRPYTRPIRGAKITGFTGDLKTGYSLKYSQNGRDGFVNYKVLDNGNVAFQFIDPSGRKTTETFEPRQRGGGGDESRGTRRGGRGRGQGGRPPGDRGDARPMDDSNTFAVTPYTINPIQSGIFKLTSPAVEDNGPLPKEYTGDGPGATLPLEWKGAPAGTKSFALVMDHLAKGPEMKCYWIMWDIPPSVTSLPRNVQGVGKFGATWKRGETYIAPHSQGGSAKTYTLHIYALTKVPQFNQPPEQVTREVLLAAIKDSIIDSADLDVIYTPSGDGKSKIPPRR